MGMLTILILMFMMLHSQAMLDIEGNLYELDYLLKNMNPNGTCQNLLNKFSKSSSMFVLCANTYAKPISMCRQCAPYVLDLTEIYQMLSNTSEEESGVLCKDILTAQDRVEIIQETYEYIAAEPTRSNPTQGLWFKGHCNSCYTMPLSHNSNHSKETKEFFDRHSIVQSCFAQYPYAEGNSERNTSEACLECQYVYQNLSDYYKFNILDQDAPFTDSVCFDILDAINMTQRIWGEKYNCGPKPRTHWTLLTLVCIVLCTPAFFYPVVRFTESSAEERVISQRHITDFFDQNLRRLAFNRSRFSRSTQNTDYLDNGAGVFTDQNKLTKIFCCLHDILGHTFKNML
ncbi:osteopetrosis-associated transmembrane protein 1 isoform X2 [Eurytemora carolleeae]|uniref:osteopetrosis-associated transmembrane protein 1 isoform X2 n=1 Tax=Eurytemora carolleeae TaxID=1294199 RepID=UPI000C78803A|nr:osteopetrosis-associated transmembrane protein 1 isoform X2 [Eurytemora carolleeae]|eukprot:XP_023334650.1 osteopetrosis-associated transmembrane protein 1-like isoform X2 [Eurytemora affinis]